jgi:DNA mismatch repair ATPase MutS
MAAAFEIFRNNAVALEEAQALAEALARYDALTGLANSACCRMNSTRPSAAQNAAAHPLPCC